MRTHMLLQRRSNLSKRKTSALRKEQQDTRFSHAHKKSEQTFYTKESKTINFAQAQKELKVNKRPVQLIPKSLNQEKYILALLDEKTDIVVVGGPAGTGKTYLAMQAAIKAMREGECDRIILTRPAVGVEDEKHGFLPGDLNQKMEPWTKPLFDVLHEYYTTRDTRSMIENEIIEICPLAFMRGRTFKNAIIIADEMQNATPNQMKMLLTRIGEGSKIVVTGDVRQTDRTVGENGLLDFTNLINKFRGSEYVGAIEFTGNDIELTNPYFNT